MNSHKIRTDAPELNFPVIIPIYGNDDASLTMTRRLISYLKENANATRFAVSFPLNPQGTNVFEKPEIYTERFAALKKLTADSGIKLGILLQQTIGHSAVWNTSPNLDLKWQRTVTMENAPSVRYCPLDKDFRTYIRTSVSAIFQHKPDFVIWDDDLRLYIQDQTECFCPLHTAYFNNKYNTSYSAQELQKLIADAPANSGILKQFNLARRETLIDFIKMIRSEIDRISPDTPSVFCTVSSNMPDMAALAQAAAGKNSPAIRIGNGLYLEREIRAIVPRLRQTAIQSATQKDKVPELLDESDICPHSLFSKTAQTMNLHIITGLLNGLDGGKLWIANTRYHELSTLDRHVRTIGKNMGLYRELHRTLKDICWQGALRSAPDPENDPHPEFPGSFLKKNDWESAITGFMGLPHRTEKADVAGIHLLTGEQIDFFSDRELEKFLSEGCILDASAADKIFIRGFGKLTGVKPVLIEKKISAGEWMTGFDFPIAAFGKKQYQLLPVDSNGSLQYISAFFDREFYQSAIKNKVCNGAALFVNEHNAKIITVPFEVSDYRMGITPERQLYMRKIFDISGVLPAWSPEPMDVYFRYGTLKNGQAVAAVCNISYEPMDITRIGLKNTPVKIEHLESDGSWSNCIFSFKNNIAEIDLPINIAAVGIFKITF